MNSYGPKTLVLGIYLLLIVAPFIGWGALYVGVRNWSLDPQQLMSWLRGLRWLSWICAVLLFGGYVVGGHYPWAYPIAMFTFSAGLSFPESWLKRRISEANNPPADCQT
jgi:hypothetical protein